MIARAAIDARALIELLDEIPRVSRQRHRVLTDLLRQHGFLIWTDKADRAELVSAIGQQDQDVVKLWHETLKALSNSARWQAAQPELDEATSNLCEQVSLPRDLKEQVDLVVVSAEVVDRRGFAEQGFGQVDGEPEISVLDVLSECGTFARIRDLKEHGNYPKGTDRSVVWKEVFGPLSRASREVTILDRYLIDAFFRSRGNFGHIYWLIEELAKSMGQGSTIRVLSEIPERNWSEPEMDRVIRTRLPDTGRQRIGMHFIMAPWDSSPVRGPHNRHIRFSCGCAIGSEEGFDRLRSQKIWGIDGFSWRYYSTPKTLGFLCDREEHILQHRDRLEFIT